jgi:hypothetical protein
MERRRPATVVAAGIAIGGVPPPFSGPLADPASTAPAGAMTSGRKATRDAAAAAIVPAERGPVFAWRPADSVVCGGKNATGSPGW